MDEVKDFALTTLDNPFSPFTQWDEWFSFDELNGYHSCSLLDRVLSNSFTADRLMTEDEMIEGAIDEIVKENPLIYKKVVKN